MGKTPGGKGQGQQKTEKRACAHWPTKGDTGPQKRSESPRGAEAERNMGKHREAERSTGKHREAERSMGRSGWAVCTHSCEQWERGQCFLDRLPRRISEDPQHSALLCAVPSSPF